MKLISINPYNLETISEIEPLTSEEIIKKIEISHKVFYEWKQTSFDDRRTLLKKLAKNILNDDSLPKLISNEVGKEINLNNKQYIQNPPEINPGDLSVIKRIL